MDSNLLTLLLGFAYPVLCIVLVRALRKLGVSSYTARHILHALVGNAVLIPLLLNPSLWAALLPPLVFVAVNAYLQKQGFEELKEDGAVLFPVSIALLILLYYLLNDPLYLLIPAFALSYGDAAAGFFGRVWFGTSKKSLKGSSAMFLALLPINYLILKLFWKESLFFASLLALVSTWAEFVSKDRDNLAVPLFTVIALNLLHAKLELFLFGLGLSLILTVPSYYTKALTLDGLIAATLLGSSLFGVDPRIFVLLFIFFASSTLLTKLMKRKKETSFEKGGARNAMQVLANGFASAVAAALEAKGLSGLPFAVASIAAATADTWATEIGLLSKSPPVLITSLEPVERGRSGGVTVLGLFASTLASIFIGISALPFGRFMKHAIVGGLLGSLLDSLLGATLQGLYICRRCGKLTEKKKHCNLKTKLISGFSWFDNDLVNLLSTFFAGLIAS